MAALEAGDIRLENGVVTLWNGTAWVPLSSLSLPAGTIAQTVSATVPIGWLFVDGSTIVGGQSTYPALWAVIPAAWKSGTNIVFPDARGRALIGAGTGAGLTARTLGALITGEETHTLTAAETGTTAHAHTSSATGSSGTVSADHTHSGTTNAEGQTITFSRAAGDSGFMYVNSTPSSFALGNGGTTVAYATFSASTGGQNNNHTHSFSTGGISANHTHAITVTPTVNAAVAASAASAHNNMQPSIAFNTMVKT